MKYLLVNPFIYDFAAYDYWLKPLGLLYISAILKNRGHRVELIDCMDRNHHLLPSSKSDTHGRGHFSSEPIPKNEILKKYPRNYKRYGLGKTKFKNLIAGMDSPDYIVISSGMTYWYPALVDTVNILKEEFPSSEILAGGTYVTLNFKHAREQLPECILFKGNSLNNFFKHIGEQPVAFSNWPPPDFSFYKNEYVAFRTSRGCPGRCPYCGINKISGGFFCKDRDTIENEINYLKRKYRTDNFVFYDDSLLRNGQLLKFLETNKLKDLNFYTPNGLEISRLDRKTSDLLKKNNFKIPKLAVDVLYNDQNKKSVKTSKKEVKRAVKNMSEAGYEKKNISAYLILGEPGQTLEEVKKSAQFLHSQGIKTELSEYGVVPGSDDETRLPGKIVKEPLLHNNSIFPTFELKKWDDIFGLKNYVNNLNGKLQ
ncbi:MAG: B12-binding domain-containing radical SAM protein [Elusimicrobiota bacterium]